MTLAGLSPQMRAEIRDQRRRLLERNRRSFGLDYVETVFADPADPRKRFLELFFVKGVPAMEDPLKSGRKRVILVSWHAEDALRFDLWVSRAEAGVQMTQMAAAHGNLVPADHGFSRRDRSLQPGIVPRQGDYAPLLADRNLTYGEPFDALAFLPACKLLKQNVSKAVPAIVLQERPPLAGALYKKRWYAENDLLEVGTFCRCFVVEKDERSQARLRFGRGTLSRRPLAGMRFSADYRVGNGTSGNLGADTLVHMALDDPALMAAIDSLSNPLPARGGTDPEPLERARRSAPQAFRSQRRAVTPDDVVVLVMEDPEVEKAAACFHWTGAWQTSSVAVLRNVGDSAEAAFLQRLTNRLGAFRLAGMALSLGPPRWVPLHIELELILIPGTAVDLAVSLVERALGKGFNPDGTPAFFNPQRLAFGQTLFLSHLARSAMAVAGVLGVEAPLFQRFGQNGGQGEIRFHALEMPQVENHADRPWLGRLVVKVGGRDGND